MLLFEEEEEEGGVGPDDTDDGGDVKEAELEEEVDEGGEWKGLE